MAIFYSETENGFFDDAVHGVLPADAVAIDQATYDQLIADQDGGLVIASDGAGNPVSQPPPEPALAEKQAIVALRIQTEAERRMAEIVALRAEVNELRRIVVDAVAPTQAQIDRWAAIDAIEGYAAANEADMQAEPDPYTYDFEDDARWTETP